MHLHTSMSQYIISYAHVYKVTLANIMEQIVSMRVGEFIIMWWNFPYDLFSYFGKISRT